ncbi:MAG TPA: glycerol kinase GlpK [Steroidobacteraceae bacterium]|jgi:glycerol kinase|nr:glycerol kinase GlpK [Steroidobacteraceae bacterium]
MASPPYLLAIDQGTTSTRAVVLDAQARPLGIARRELTQHYPGSARVEHDAEDIWRDTLATAREALQRCALSARSIAALGITNQRETTLIWERATGKPIHRAIVWQDRRTAGECAALKAAGAEALVRQRTGLVLDPYFSGTKIAWLLDNVPAARARAERGELAFGTIDTFLLWRLTNGRLHATDATNASRTLLFNLHTQDWDDELLRLLRVPRELLPQVRDSSGDFGASDASLLGAQIPIRGVAGDQQAALVGQGCFERGMAKSTYGTGCFLLLNTGEVAVRSTRMLTTVAYRLGGRTTYAMEGSIFVAGAAVKWLRDGLHVLRDAAESAAAAANVPDDHGVYLVPAFVGLGAPHWEPDARGLICGLTLDSGGAHLVRAALEAVAYQTRDLTEAMTRDGALAVTAIRVDGGMAANDWFCQFLADILAARVERPAGLEATVTGAAFLAGLAAGVWADLPAIAACVETAVIFSPRMSDSRRATLLRGWRDALARALPGRSMADSIDE